MSVTAIIKMVKRFADKARVLLSDALTRFRAARALPLFSFQNEREMRNFLFCCFLRVSFVQKNDGLFPSFSLVIKDVNYMTLCLFKGDQALESV